MIERFWPELNRHVNYPIKRAMISITNAADYDDEDEVVRFVYSYISMYLVQNAAHHLIDSYNHHRIPGPNGGVPIKKMESTKRTIMLPENVLPTTQEAVMMYEAEGSRLTCSSEFGYDPLPVAKYDQRNHIFRNTQPSSYELFSDVVHENYGRLRVAFDCFYTLTVTL